MEFPLPEASPKSRSVVNADDIALPLLIIHRHLELGTISSLYIEHPLSLRTMPESKMVVTMSKDPGRSTNQSSQYHHIILRITPRNTDSRVTYSRQQLRGQRIRSE